jgi:hypothetical protein
MEPEPTHAVGERDVVTRIFVFPPGSTAVSNWDDETKVELHVTGRDEARLVHIVANVAGLRSLARHCLTLAQEGVTDAQHLDYDADSGWFDTDDVALRIERAWD